MWIAIAIVGRDRARRDRPSGDGAVARHHRSAEPRDAQARRGRRRLDRRRRRPRPPASESVAEATDEARARADDARRAIESGGSAGARAARRGDPARSTSRSTSTSSASPAGSSSTGRSSPASGLGPRRLRRRGARVPVAVGERRLRRQGRRRLGGRRQDRHRQQDAVLQRQRQDLHRRLPEGRPPEGEEGPGVHAADHRRDGSRVRRALPEVRAPRLPRAVVPELAVVRVPVPRLEVQPGRREAGWPGAARPRPLRARGRRAATSSSTPATSCIGPPIGTEHHRPEPRRARPVSDAHATDATARPGARHA